MRAGAAQVLCLIAAGALAAGCRSRSTDANPAQPRPSFRVDIEPVLARHCAAAEGCHGDQPTRSVSLDLRPGNAHKALVGAPAKTRAGAVRVVPGAPERSFIVDKLLGSLAFGEGKPMPVDPQTGAPPETSPLAPGFVDGVLKPWIARGAPSD